MKFEDYNLSSFREELLTSAGILLLVMIGSFFTVSRIFTPHKSNETKSGTQELAQILTTLAPTAEPAQVLGQIQTPTTTPPPSPTIDPLESEVAFGKGGFYDYEAYKLQIDSPRLAFNIKEAASRKLKVDFVLTNKTVSSGLPLKMSASIMKDGNIIVPETAMSLSENKVILPGESQKFQATISLVEATDVKELIYKPLGDLPQIIHPLKTD